MSISINERAANKAFAKIMTLKDEVKSLRKYLSSRNLCQLSIDQLEGVLKGTIIELDTWEYISNLIEKDE